MGKHWKQCETLFFWAPKSLQMVIAAMKLKKKKQYNIVKLKNKIKKRNKQTKIIKDTYYLEGKL